MLTLNTTEETVVRVHCSPPNVPACKDAWEELQDHPNVDWEFFHLINASRKQIEGSVAFELERRSETDAIWVGRVETMYVKPSLGYLKLNGFPLRTLTVTTGGVLGDKSEETCRLMLKKALAHVKENRLDLLTLSYVRCDHILFELATTGLPSGFLSDWAVIPSPHWTMQLPASFLEFLETRSRKHRYWLKRLPRILEEAFPGAVRIQTFRTKDEVAGFCIDADKLSRITYQHHLGEAFRADAEFTARCELFADKGAFRGYILYLDNEPRAYWMATAYRNVLHLNYTGYDPNFRRFELGTVLLMELFKDHCGSSVQKVDFGHGAAPYKERFGDESFSEATVRVYRFTPKTWLANVVNVINSQTSRYVKTVLARLGLLQKIKSLWRARLSR